MDSPVRDQPLLTLKGFHHLTAVTASAPRNYLFYTEVLGLRLVKRTVNQDDVSSYHLYYADAVGTPGTDITFFDWKAPRESRGTRSVVRTGLRVPGQAALDYWKRRFEEKEVLWSAVKRDGRAALDFEDGEGQRLTLAVEEQEGGVRVPWERGPVPPSFQIRGLGPITISVPALQPTHEILTRVMNMRVLRESRGGSDEAIHVYGMEADGLRGELHVVAEPGLARAAPGAGGVHHVAFRTPDQEQYHLWQQRLNRMGVPNSGEIDRFYFRSLYFRDPGGILFEIATDGPGFAVDEDLEHLGETVSLPPFLERQRAQILANLEPFD